MIVVSLGGNRLLFGELQHEVDGISRKVLAETLRDLERDGIIARYAYAQMPPRVEYELTELGRTLQDPLHALRMWAEGHYDEVSRACDAYDTRATPPLVSKIEQ